MRTQQPVCCNHAKLNKNQKVSLSESSQQRQYFNFLRNNSSSVYNVFTWDHLAGSRGQCQQNCVIDARGGYIDQYASSQGGAGDGYHHRNTNQNQNYMNSSQKRVSFDNTNAGNYQKQNPKDKLNLSAVQTRASQTLKSRTGGVGVNLTQQNQKNVLHESPKRVQIQLSEKQQKIRQEQQQSKVQNRRKVQQYVQSQRPYTRDFPNSKYQNYFGRAALQSYGRANTNQPIGGIIYGNHQKTFNVNPHCYTNQPKYYQSHTTALNFGKRTKLNDQQRWTLLTKQLTKKLGLKDKNQHIKQGKQIVYVDVDDSNMYDVMRQNCQFKKDHRQQIREAQNQFKKQKQAEKQAKVQEFYANKKAKIEQGLEKTMASSNAGGSSYYCDRQEKDRVNQQVVYRYHDQNGNQRIAVDRHGITCYVDMNFPQNDAAYTAELKSRMPIFPIECKAIDRNIDPVRRDNYIKSLDNVYPSHYLLPNCQQPEVLKMLSEKAGKLNKSSSNNQNSGNKRGVSAGKALNSQGKAQVTAKNPNNSRGAIMNAGNNSNAINNNRGKSVANQQQKDTIGSTNYQQQQQQQQNNGYIMGDTTFNNQSNNYEKNELMNKAWRNQQFAANILNQQKIQCCGNHHLPSNQKDPYNYHGVSSGRIPIAGKCKN